MSRGNAPVLYLVKSGKISVMTKRVSLAAYKRAFQKKIASAQDLSGLSDEEIAGRLGISEDQFTRYKSRYWMRVDLIAPYCKITGIDLDKFLAAPPIRKSIIRKSV